MHHVLVQNSKVVHIWHGPVPPGIENIYPVAPGSANVGDGWDGQKAVPQAPAITVDEVNMECERRILEVFPLTRQLNIIDEGTSAELDDMKAKRNALRACARALASMKPIPQNFRDDRFWTGAAFQGSNGSSGYQGNGFSVGYANNGQASLGGHSTNQPIIMMQAPAQPAPIIINGASPGTTIVQGPAQVQQPQSAQINVVTPPAPAPAIAPAMPSPSHQSAPAGLPSPSSPHMARSIDEDEILYETAARALSGQQSAIDYMIAIATHNGQQWQPYCEALMKERFERFDRVLKSKAAQ